MQRELDIAVDAVLRAGAAVAAIQSRPDFEVRFKAGDKGPLTEADLDSDRILEDQVHGAFPDDGWLSEETADSPERLGKKRVWIIDPLDGTREFTLRIPEYCISVGLVVEGEPVLGVLYNPAANVCIAGYRGGEVTRNGVPVKVSAHDKLDGGRFLVSRSEYEKGWFDAYKDRATLRPMGSVAWKFALVAAGEAEATFTPEPRNEWDLCGGVAVVLAAGGRASDGSGAPYRFNRPDPLHKGVCGTNGHVHEAVLGLMRR